jgi:hypothetical protein
MGHGGNHEALERPFDTGGRRSAATGVFVRSNNEL